MLRAISTLIGPSYWTHFIRILIMKFRRNVEGIWKLGNILNSLLSSSQVDIFREFVFTNVYLLAYTQTWFS